jgi:hypothetical protein
MIPSFVCFLAEWGFELRALQGKYSNYLSHAPSPKVVCFVLFYTGDQRQASRQVLYH